MKKLFLLISLFVLSFATNYHRGYVDFKKIVEKNIAGNIETIGNTVECVTNLKFAKSLNDINNASCSNDLNKNDNNYLIKYINVLDHNSSIFNSSTAVLKFPSSYKRIVWAALFWQGHINNYSYQYSFTNRRNRYGYDEYYDDQYYENGHIYVYEYINRYGNPYYHISNDLPNNDYKNGIKQTSANEVKLFINNIPYDIEANEVDYKSNKRYFWDDKKQKWLKKYGVKYSAYAVLSQNIIDKLNSIAASNSNEVNITVANIKTTFGLDERLGDYGAWSLVVIYQEIPKPQNFRSNMVYYGFKVFNKVDQKINIPITGLVLPKYGNVSSRLSVFSGEGDYIYKGDENNPESIRINGEYLDENLTGYDKYNVFDSRLSDDIERYPKLINNNGIDIDVFDASKQLTEIRNNEREENPSRVTYDVNITASTYNDAVFLSAIAFSTQLYVPKVCYYDLNLYDKNGNKITSSSKLTVGEKIKVQYKIKNDENETAVNVNVLYPFDNNITKYIQNSTYVKNVLADEYIHIDDNHSVGNLGVEVNNTRLYIGILGDSENEFKPYSVNPKYVAGIEFNLSLQKEGNLSFDFYTDYNYTIGGEPYSYKGILPNCNEFSNTYSVYQPKIGAFNVVHYQPSITNDPVDVNDSINALYTQIVNQDFNVTVVKLGDDNKTLENYTGFVKLDLIQNPKNENECKTLPSLIPPRYIEFNNESKKNITLRINKAYRNVRFRIRYLKYGSGCFESVLNLITNFNPSNLMNAFSSCSSCATTCATNMSKCSDLDSCEEGVNACLDCVFSKGEVETVCSRDNFAVRPYAFLVFGQNQYKRAGEDFNITIKAVDKANYNKLSGVMSDITGVSGYNTNLNDLNVSAKFYTPTNSEIKQMNDDIGFKKDDTNKSRVAYCPDPGIFTIVSGNKFTNGVVNATMKYSESGILTLRVAEINGSEFAKVDEKDTPDSQRLIKPATFIINENNLSQRNLLLEFIPYKFVTDGIYSSTTGGFVYMNNINNSMIPKMAAFLEYNITAENKDNQKLLNYTKTCFPDVSNNAPSRNGLKLNTTFDLFLDNDINVSNKANVNFANVDIKDNSNIQLLHPELNLTKGIHHIQQWISPLNFNLGEGNVKLFFNIKKDYRHPKNEVNITVKDINTSTSWMNNPGATKIFVGKDLNKTINFRYGRIDVQDISGYGNELNTTFKYEYWTNLGWKVNKEHNSSIFGDVNKTKSYLPNVTLKLNPIDEGEENVTISTTHALPYSTKIHLSIPSWLWYHPLAKPYKDPSSTNLDCLTHPCFNVEFMKEGNGWGGVTSGNDKNYSVNKRTANITATTSKIKAEKSEVRKLNW